MKLKNKELEKAVDEFAKQMKLRLAEKESQGFEGWDKDKFPADNTNLIKRSIKKWSELGSLPKDLKTQCVDTANFMMMIHYRNTAKDSNTAQKGGV